MAAESKKVTCLEFQTELPELLKSEEDLKDLFWHPHPQSCGRCHALLVDLEIIAEKARGLYPGEGPFIH